jgi:hypothetical protein
MTKGERLYKDMKALGKIEVWTWKMDKERATLKKNSWTREAHK